MEKKELMTLLKCELCSKKFSSRVSLSEHWRDSPCGTSGITDVPAIGQEVSVSSGSQIVRIPCRLFGKKVSVYEGPPSTSPCHFVTVTSVPSIGFQKQGETSFIKVSTDVSCCGEEASSACNVDINASGKTSAPGNVVLPPIKEESLEIGEEQVMLSVEAPLLPSELSSECGVSPEVVPASGVSGSVTDVPVFVTDDSVIFNQEDKGVNLSLVVDAGLPNTQVGSQSPSQSESQMAELPATIHLQQNTLIGPVAMEIHIPMHAPITVGEYVEHDSHKDDGSELFFAEDRDKINDSGDKLSETVLNVPKISWSSNNQGNDNGQERQLKRKQRNVSGVHKFCCEYCGRTYSKSSNLNRHRHTHTGAKYNCSDCDKKFAYKETLKSHRETYHCHGDSFLSYVYKCKFCHRIFSTTSELGVHHRTHTYDKPFECQECKKTFTRKSGLTKHELIHTAKKPYECAVCKKRFLRKPAMERHKIIHSAIKPYKCSLCKKSFGDKYACRNHEKLHNADRVFACRYCPKSFKSATTARMHETIHTREKCHVCSKCTERFGTSIELKIHMRLHWKAEFKENVTLEANQCKECGAKFTHRSTLRAHQRTHTGEIPYKCQTCQKGFIYFASWRRHLKMHKGEKSFICKKCGKGFTKGLYLKRHQNGLCHGGQQDITKDNGMKSEASSVSNLDSFSQSVTATTDNLSVEIPSNTDLDKGTYLSHIETNVNHPFDIDVKPFACEFCGKMYKSNSTLKRHLKTHSGKKPFPCNICGKGYSRKPILTEHKIMVHGEGHSKPIYPCTDCIKSFPSLKRLEIHRRKHTGERPHTCLVCSKTFKDMSTLKRHERIHLNLKPFKCVVCKRGFNDKGNLQKHEATHGIKGEEGRASAESSWTPFTCEDCGKTFKQLGYLRYHQRMHKGDRQQFSCEACDRTFAQAANLHSHMQSHTEKMFKCSVCSMSYRRESKLQEHIDRNHAVKKCFVCGQCGKVLASKASLKRHESTHLGLEPYSCPICKNSFNQKVSLKSHLRSHKDDVLFCERCEQAFFSKEDFEEHGQKENCSLNHICNICERPFSSKIGLANHQQTHKVKNSTSKSSGEHDSKKKNVYVCDICHNNFEKKKMLSKHKKAHRKGKI